MSLCFVQNIESSLVMCVDAIHMCVDYEKCIMHVAKSNIYGCCRTLDGFGSFFEVSKLV